MRIFRLLLVGVLGFFLYTEANTLNLDSCLVDSSSSKNQSQTPSPPTKKSEPKAPISPDPQVEIPKTLRVFNKSGSQCVFATTQMLGSVNNSAGCKNLTDTYKHTCDPSLFASIMNSRNVKFIQSIEGGEAALNFFEEYVTRRRNGAGFGIYNVHCILMCHFERNKLVKIIDNSDPELRIQTWDWETFNRARDRWVFTILPDDFPSENHPAEENPAEENPGNTYIDPFPVIIYPIYPVYSIYPVYPGNN